MTHLIRQMGYVVIAAPDPDRSARDLADITGVRISHSAVDATYVSSNARFCEVAYLRGDKHGIRAVGLEAMDEAAVDEVQRRAQSDGLTILSDTPLLPQVKRAVRFATPFGPIFEVHTPIAREAIASASLNGKRVRRLEHVNLRATDPRGFHDLVTRLLGMKLSDRTTQYERAWYRAADGFHHTFAAGPGNGLHHYAFDAHGLYDLAGTADALVAKGRNLLWGVAGTGRATICFPIISIRMDAWWRCLSVLSASTTTISMNPATGRLIHRAMCSDRWGSKPPEAYGKSLTPFVR